MTAAWSLDSGWASRPLAGEVALVTGSMGGLGRAICRGLAAAGAAIAVQHRHRPEEASEFADELRRAGVATTVVQSDLTDWDAVATMYERIAQDLGPVSVLVNNAGLMRKQTFVDLTLEAWQETIDADLTGTFIATRHALPAMLAAGRGVVVNVASQLAFKGAREYVAYSAAKGGVIAFTHALAREVGPAIRVNAIAPGPIETPMTDAYTTPEWVAERTAGMVLGRLGQPDEVVSAVVFLASPGAELMHGQTIHLNGGGVMA